MFQVGVAGSGVGMDRQTDGSRGMVPPHILVPDSCAQRSWCSHVANFAWSPPLTITDMIFF